MKRLQLLFLALLISPSLRVFAAGNNQLEPEIRQSRIASAFKAAGASVLTYFALMHGFDNLNVFIANLKNVNGTVDNAKVTAPELTKRAVVVGSVGYAAWVLSNKALAWAKHAVNY